MSAPVISVPAMPAFAISASAILGQAIPNAFASTAPVDGTASSATGAANSATAGAASSASTASAVSAAVADPLSSLAFAALLLVLGAFFLLLEFFVVSGGLLLLFALLCGAGAVALGFSVSTTAGLLLSFAVPGIAVVVTIYGFQRLRRSPAVASGEITADAGIHHAASRSGVGLGSIGTLVTDAFPTGRARFTTTTGSHCELDVEVQGAIQRRGARVSVIAIDGPVIQVAAAPA